MYQKQIIYPQSNLEEIMSQENKDLVRRFFELLELNLKFPEDLLGPGFRYHVAGSPPMDLKAAQERMEGIIAAFSNNKHIVEDIVAEDDKVAFRAKMEMTHIGEFMGATGSDQQISIVEMGMMRIENGKVAEMWGFVDTMGLMQQIGALPSPSRPRSA